MLSIVANIESACALILSSSPLYTYQSAYFFIIIMIFNSIEPFASIECTTDEIIQFAELGCIKWNKIKLKQYGDWSFDTKLSKSRNIIENCPKSISLNAFCIMKLNECYDSEFKKKKQNNSKFHSMDHEVFDLISCVCVLFNGKISK